MKLFLCLGIALALIACSNNDSMNVEKSEIADTFMSCHSQKSRKGIVNGSAVSALDPDSKQAVLLIIRRGKDIQSCTGAPISNRVILTAAHCLKGADKTSVTVVFHPEMTCASGYDISKSIPSTDILVHKKYDGKSNADSDLGLVKLAAPIPASYPVQSIYDGESPVSSDQVLMIGYGISNEGAEDSLFLRKVTKSFKNQTSLREQNIIFDQRGDSGGVCSGDSGGPVYVQVDGQYKIIGINSVVAAKDEKTACHGVSVGMYMPSFSDWVKENISRLK